MNDRTRRIFRKAVEKGRAYTFSDLTLQDIPSNVLPTQSNLGCNVTYNYRLKKPIISAAMDTVTEADMAVTMAKNGGLAVIHRNLSIEDQVAQVEWVRRQVHYGGKINNPVTFLENNTVAELQHAVQQNNWSFTSFPITDHNSCLVGMVTKDELGFVGNDNPQLKDIMKPLGKLIISNESIDAEEAFRIMSGGKVKKLPLVSSSGGLKGMYVWADVRKNQETRAEFSLDKSGRLLVAAAVGPGPDERERIDKLVEVGCPILVVDCSHGACKAVAEQIIYIRKKDVDIIAGNVASYESAMYLLKNANPDAIKVGISPGSICTTRKVTGHGVPQLTAIYQVRAALQDCTELKGRNPIPIIADGGITCSGDIVKALVAGADCVMLGGALAGTDESPGEIITQNNKKYKSYRGMGSRAAMTERSGSRTRYFKGNTSTEMVTEQQQNKITPEGIEALVEYKGTVTSILDELCGGIQSGMAHSNATTIDQLRQNAIFWLQSSAGYVEGNPHSVVDYRN